MRGRKIVGRSLLVVVAAKVVQLVEAFEADDQILLLRLFAGPADLVRWLRAGLHPQRDVGRWAGMRGTTALLVIADTAGLPCWALMTMGLEALVAMCGKTRSDIGKWKKKKLRKDESTFLL